ncbi:uncharacterized protein BDV17DRAFT_256619 [Aspergillus undulatus]|uniref:uncharacterized protein n=1 Tax=Aspergillus undulatus TaxID=1810928 RepID=UPI003CCD27E5
MLRCSNAAALRAQITTNLAPRALISSSSTWPRAPPHTHTHTIRHFALSATSLKHHTDTSANEGAKWERIKPRRRSLDRPPPSKDASPETEAEKQKQQEYQRDPLMQVATNQAPAVPKKIIAAELMWLADPLQLANRVRDLLKEKKIALAAEICRAALYNGYDCVVAWNAIFKYCYQKNHPKAAFRFWNDMKKRGGRPNAYSYTHMLHGLSTARKHREVDPLRMAKSIYQQLLDPKNKFKPSIIQTNAMLSVCQNQPGAMDLLWEIAGSLPEEGEGSPDRFTYAIILNAIRRDIQRETSALQSDRNGADRAYFIRLRGIMEAKKVWADIVHRWKKGDVQMSNGLVSAMAGCLWEGTGDQHLYEVLRLYYQTAGIPILAEKPLRGSMDVSKRAHSQMGGNNRPSGKREAEEGEDEEEVPFVDAKGREYSSSRQPQDENLEAEIEELKEEEDSFSMLFDPIVPQEVKAYSGSQYIELPDGAPNYIPIGNRELSVLLETVLQMTVPVPPGKAYWKWLTQRAHDYLVQPDHRSLISYLRILRVGRGSRHCVEVLQDQISSRGIEQGLPFHIALSVCRRDRKNPNILKNANDLLYMMDMALMMPDYRAISTYLDLIHSLEKEPQDLVNMNGLGDIEKIPTSAGKLTELGRQLRLNLRKSAVAALRPLVIKLDDAMSESLDKKPALSGRSGVDPELVRLQGAPTSELLAVLPRVRLLVDTILKTETGKLLSEEDKEVLMEDSRRLRKYSKVDIIKKFEEKGVKFSAFTYPTFEQQLAYHQRIGDIERGATRPDEDDSSEAAWDLRENISG